MALITECQYPFSSFDLRAFSFGSGAQQHTSLVRPSLGGRTITLYRWQIV
jgi:hypothetical protein